MRISLAADESYPVHQAILAALARRGHTTEAFGAFAGGKDAPWAVVARQAALSVAGGECDEGIFLCWTGTGISIAANKVRGVRAALCADAGTAAGARIWNHANVLCLSHRTLSDDIAKEILAAWFDTPMDARGDAGVALLVEG